MAVGIDLGTTYSCVAVWRHDRGEVIANDQGNRLTPSCVAFTSDKRLVGEAAINQATLNPSNTIFGENLFSFFLKIISFPLCSIRSEVDVPTIGEMQWRVWPLHSPPSHKTLIVQSEVTDWPPI
uniref:Uncharacterized protein n=1 Tax=Leersia perrieri TaxID=77586 RepID=A0A0D9XQ00_9ORYZ